MNVFCLSVCISIFSLSFEYDFNDILIMRLLKKLGDFLIFFLISWVCPSGVNGAEVLVGGICIMIFRYGKQQQVIDRHHQPGLAGVNSSWCCVFTSEVRGPRNFPLAFRILKRNGFFFTTGLSPHLYVAATHSIFFISSLREHQLVMVLEFI